LPLGREFKKIGNVNIMQHCGAFV